jgi:hypothetical protein
LVSLQKRENFEEQLQQFAKPVQKMHTIHSTQENLQLGFEYIEYDATIE